MISKRCRLIAGFILVKIAVLYLVLNPQTLDASIKVEGEDTSSTSPSTTNVPTAPALVGEKKIEPVEKKKNEAPSNPQTVARAPCEFKLTAIIHTELGPITFLFYPKEAPKTVRNFIDLSRMGFFNGTTFYRYEPNFVLQGGSWPTKPSALPNVPLEYKLPNAKNFVSMARTSDPNTGSSEFSIMLTDNSKWLGPGGSDPYGYAVFAEVVAGFETIETIGKRKIKRGQPLTLLDPAVKILTIDVVNKTSGDC